MVSLKMRSRIAAYILVFLAISLASCSSCVDIPLREAHSPDGAFTARLLERRCGQPQDGAQRLILQRRNFWSRFFSGTEVFILDNLALATLSWATDSRGLEVRYEGGQVFKQLPHWEGVQLRYLDPVALAAAAALAIPAPGTTVTQTQVVRKKRVIGRGPHRRER